MWPDIGRLDELREPGRLACGHLHLLPDPSAITEKAAPKAAAWDIPSVKGEPRGLPSTDCMITPATESPAPARMAARTWGSLMLKTTTSSCLETWSMKRVLNTSSGS